MQNEESSRRAEEEGPAAFLEYFMNMAHGATPVGLDFIHWIKDTSELPVITKGILTGTIIFRTGKAANLRLNEITFFPK